MQTINDVTAAVAERFGVGITEDGLELAVRAAVPGRYEDVELSDAFLRSVWSAWQPDAAYPFGGVSEELAGGLAAYSARIDALGGYGARVRATMPNGVVREGELFESGYGGCQPSLRDADGREWRIPSIMTAERV